LRKGILVQLLIVTIGMIIWNLGNIAFGWQNERYVSELSRQPMLLYSRSYDKLTMLRDELNQFPYVSFVSIEADTLVARNLIDTYKLDQAENILNNYTLPSVMTIYFFGENFVKANQENLYDLITNKYEISNVIFNDKEANHIKDQLSEFNFIYKAIYLVYGILFFIILLMMRIYYERRQDRFWEIYRLAGGKAGGRGKRYLWYSFLLLLFPAIFMGGIYYAALHLGYLSYHIINIHFYIQAGVVIATSLLARLFLGRKF